MRGKVLAQLWSVRQRVGRQFQAPALGLIAVFKRNQRAAGPVIAFEEASVPQPPVLTPAAVVSVDLAN